jgi:hypothetical protein
MIEVGKFILGILASLFTKGGWVGVAKNWKGIVGVALLGIAVIWLLLTYNPFDDAAAKAARAEAKAERQQATACQAQVAQANARLQRADIERQHAAAKAAEDARANAQQELENLRVENARLHSVVSSTRRAYSPETLKELAR